MGYSVGIVNLGCAKNQVDAEVMLKKLEDAGYEVKDDPSSADAVIINTCAFIDAAKRESIDNILEFAKLKNEGKVKAIVVTGCLAERYRGEVMKELPETDAVSGIGANGDIVKTVAQALGGAKPQQFPPKDRLPLCGTRRLLTPAWYAYVKIAEGCDNRCAYCAIPSIRGRYRSRTLEDITAEAESLAAKGVREIILVAQDTSKYGRDIYGGRLMLPELLKRLCAVDGIKWIRILYCYPDTVTEELLTVIASEKKVVNYIDLPLQHCSGRVLKAMRRAGDRRSLTELINKMREKVPGLTLRTTLMVGFPGETDADFEELCGFVKEMRFERLGCFSYSREEGTLAAGMPDQIDGEVKRRRLELITEEQMNIMQEQGGAMKGKTLEVLCEGIDAESGLFIGRSAMDSPDVDGSIIFSAAAGRPRFGEFANVKVTGCRDGDLYGETVPLGG